ncbi:MAG: hypothetical protein ACOY93_08350 [Bacillota bacterium]
MQNDLIQFEFAWQERRQEVQDLLRSRRLAREAEAAQRAEAQAPVAPARTPAPCVPCQAA